MYTNLNELFTDDPDSEWYRVAPAVWELNEYASRLIKESLPITQQPIVAIPKRLFNVAP